MLHMEVIPRSDRGQTPDTEDLNSYLNIEEEEDDILERPAFPLNSRRLNVARIRQLASALDIPTLKRVAT